MDCKHEFEVKVEYDDWGIFCAKCDDEINQYVILPKAEYDKMNDRIDELEILVEGMTSLLLHIHNDVFDIDSCIMEIEIVNVPTFEYLEEALKVQPSDSKGTEKHVWDTGCNCEDYPCCGH